MKKKVEIWLRFDEDGEYQEVKTYSFKNIIEFEVYKWYIEKVLIISDFFFYGSSPAYPKSITKS